jgi:hypothetical protein
MPTTISLVNAICAALIDAAAQRGGKPLYLLTIDTRNPASPG